MKIVVINNRYKPDHRGGAEVVTESIARGLVQLGHDVSVIAVGRKQIEEEIDGIRVYRIKPFNLFNFLDIDRYPVWLRLPWHVIDTFNDLQTWRIFKVLEKIQPDLVITNNLKGLGYYISWVLKIMKIKHIHLVHDHQLIHPSGLYDSGKKLSLFATGYMRICRWLFGSPDAVIYPSRFIQNNYQRYKFFPNSKQEVIGNPLSIDFNFNPEQKFDCPRQVIFGYLGQLQEYKGVKILLDAFARVTGDHQLWIIGSGPLADLVRQAASTDQRIKFYDWLDQTELREKIWSRLNVLVQPSLTAESFGMTVIEAQSHGIPALASRIGALPELVDQGRTGWLVEPGDVDQLAQNMQQIAEHYCGYGSIRINAFNQAKEFDLDQYLNKLLASATIEERTN